MKLTRTLIAAAALASFGVGLTSYAPTADAGHAKWCHVHKKLVWWKGHLRVVKFCHWHRL